MPRPSALEEVDVLVIETKSSKKPQVLASPATAVAKGTFIWSKYVTAEDTFIKTAWKDEGFTDVILLEKKEAICKPYLDQVCEA